MRVLVEQATGRMRPANWRRRTTDPRQAWVCCPRCGHLQAETPAPAKRRGRARVDLICAACLFEETVVLVGWGGVE